MDRQPDVVKASDNYKNIWESWLCWPCDHVQTVDTGEPYDQYQPKDMP